MTDIADLTRPDRPRTLKTFNGLSRPEAHALLSACLAVERWVDAVVAGRPYATIDDLLEAARESAFPFTAAELGHALGAMGDRPLWTTFAADGTPGWRTGGARLRERFQRQEAAYERRFGRPFLIRTTGRSADEVLDHLERRLGHDPAAEEREAGQQLRQVALLALSHRVVAV